MHVIFTLVDDIIYEDSFLVLFMDKNSTCMEYPFYFQFDVRLLQCLWFLLEWDIIFFPPFDYRTGIQIMYVLLQMYPDLGY